MSRTNDIYLVSEEWKIIHKVGAKTVLNQLFYFGQNDSVCLDLVLFLVLVLVRMGLMKLPLMLLTEMVGWLVELELVSKGKLDSLLLHLGKPVLVLGDLRQGGLDEVALHAGDG